MVRKHRIQDAILHTILLLWGIGIVFPLFWILYESLKTNQQFFADAWALPTHLEWGSYVKAWQKLGVGQALLNTFYYVAGGLVLGTFLITICTYSLTRLQFKGRNFIWGLIMMSLFLPGINALIPQYVLMRSLRMTNSLTGLIVLDSLAEVAFFMILLGGFMQTLPKELEESAVMDGASLFQVFVKVIAPLSLPGIVTVAIFKFLSLYNNFFAPFIYLSDQKKYTIGVNMYQANQMMRYNADWVALFAGVMIATVPSIIIFVLFQRRIVNGATVGAIKG